MELDIETRRRKLLYQARHRGTKEADAVIGGYVERHIASMDVAALDELDAILACQDPDLMDWLLGLAPIPAERDSVLLRSMRDALV